MLNITLKTVQMTELNRYSPIRARTEEYKCADWTFSDLVAGRQKPATVRHRASGAANAAADGCGERAPPPARHSCRGMAVAGGGCGLVTSWRGRCAADGRGRYVRRVDRISRGLCACARAPIGEKISNARAWTHGCAAMQKRSVRICCATMFESLPSLTVAHFLS